MNYRESRYSEIMKAPAQIESPGTAAHIVPAQLAVERVRTDALLSQRRAEAIQMLDDLRRMPKIGPQLTDSAIYDKDGLPK
jgi:hypothetical protein